MSVDTATTTTGAATVTTITVDKATLKALILQLFKEDKDFLREIADLAEAEKEPKFDKLPQDMTDEEHAEFMKHIEKKYANKMSDFLPLRELFKDELPAEELVKML